MGVAGSGKTTVAQLLADTTGAAFVEADDLHPAANVVKMSAGHALDDDDRAPWLAAIRDRMDAEARAGRRTVLTCSALRRPYRDVLATATGRVVFVHLDGDPELLAARIAARTGHFMPPALLASQLATLEPLDPDEDGYVVDVTPPPETVAGAVRVLLVHAGQTS
ncbi:gluconokinase [Luteimicrobium subarcticum]|nr:gluconokinase [Luteimicrobium subarcticum]